MKKLLVLSLLTMILIVVYDLFSFHDGFTGRTAITSNGCGGTGCHGPNKQSSTNVLMGITSSSNFSLYPLEEIEITVSLRHFNCSWSGINIAVKNSSSGDINVGTLTPVSSYLKLMNNELTHTEPVPITNNYSYFIFKWRAPKTPGTYYVQAIGIASINNENANYLDEWRWLVPTPITVLEPPRTITLTSPNGLEKWCTEDHNTITWTQSYVDSVKIELSTDGGNFYQFTLIDDYPAENGTWNWTIPQNIQGKFNKIRISDYIRPNVMDVSNNNFTIEQKTKITNNPSARFGCIGDTVTFNITAEGENLSYQWKHDSKNMQNANDSSLTISNIKAENAGYYTVLITGDCGNALSGDAQLYIYPKSVITLQPKNDTICLGTDHNVFIYIEDEYKTVSWFKDGTLLTKSDAKTYSIHNVSYNDAGKYNAVVENRCGDKTLSDTISVLVTGKPNVVTHPENSNVKIGNNALFNVKSDMKIVNYQWRKDTINIEGANDSVLTIKNAQFTDAGSYNCIIFNECGADTSQTATLTVNEKGSDAILSLEQDSIDLGYIILNKDTTIIFKDFIKNTGSETLIIYSMLVKGDDATAFKINNFKDSSGIIPSGSMDLNLSCSAKDTGYAKSFIEFNTNADATGILPIKAFGTILNIVLAKELNFDNVSWDQQLPIEKKLFAYNKSNIPVTIDTIGTQGIDSVSFSIKTIQFPIQIQREDSLGIIVEFNPETKEEREYNAGLSIHFIEFDTFYYSDLILNYTNTSVENEFKQNIKIYPNPATNIINIELNTDGYYPESVSLYNILGEKIFNDNKIYLDKSQNKLKLNLSQDGNYLPNGMYILVIKINGNPFVFSIAINN